MREACLPGAERFDVALVALSARTLSLSAQRAGLVALAVDLFADSDTVAAAGRAFCLPRCGEWCLDPHAVEEMLAAWCAPGGDLVVGTGFEEHGELLGRLALTYRLVGNAPETVVRLKDPFALAALLRCLDIPHPCVFKATPNIDHVVKRAGASGGAHIRPAGAWLAPGDYAQAQISGRSVSALLLANGSDCRLIGLSEQWTCPAPHAPFRYGGAVGPVLVDPLDAATIQEICARLVEATGLVGLNSFDFILTSQGPFLIEINPRPGASLDLFDRPPLPALLALHMEACGGPLPYVPPMLGNVRAAGILYADETLELGICPWPDWAADRPSAGTLVAAGDPVVTLFAEAETPGAARALLETRMSNLKRDLAIEYAA